MYCIYCGKEIPDDAEFCTFCGKSVSDRLPGQEDAHAEEAGAGAAPQSPAPAYFTAVCRQEKKPMGALTLTGFVVSVIAFVAGFILLTMSLCESAGAFDLFYMLPAFAGLIMSLTGLMRREEGGKPLAIAGIALSGFIILYYFIAAFVLSGMSI